MRSFLSCLVSLFVAGTTFEPGKLKFAADAPPRPTVEYTAQGDVIVYPDGSRVRIRSAWLRSRPGQGNTDLSLVFSTGDNILFEREGRTLSFALQNRTLDEYGRYFFPERWTKPENLTGLRVLDVGCGTHARAVEAWKEAGVDAFGIDLYLNRDLRDKDHVAMLDALRSGLVGKQFDHIYLAYGPLSYSDEEVPRPVKLAFLKEMMRLLKRRGSLRIGPADYDDLRALVREAGVRATLERDEESGAVEIKNRVW